MRGKEEAIRLSRRLNLHLVTKEERTTLVQSRYSNIYIHLKQNEGEREWF